MKKFAFALSLLALGLPVQSNASTATAMQAMDSAVAAAIQLTGNVDPANLIDWKVGDKLNYKVSANGMGDLGTMTKEATREEGDALWIKQEIKLMGRDEVIEMLLRRADGKVLKLVRNGREMDIPDNSLEIISQEYTNITVPAGTFDAIYIIAKTKDVDKLEVWINMRDTAMDGTLKQVVPTGFLTLAFELTSFTKN